MFENKNIQRSIVQKDYGGGGGIHNLCHQKKKYTKIYIALNKLF